MTAAAVPDERARRDPAGACIADERQDLDNAGFAQKVTAVAAVFAAAGLGRGGVLAIMVPNRVELITSMFAAWRLGAAVTPVNPGLTAQEARYQIDDAGATLVVADDAAAAMLRDGPYRIIGLEEVTAPLPPGAARPGAFVTLRPGHTAVPEDIMEHCRLSLARYKVPRAVYIEETLPRARSGKSPSQCFANACGSRNRRTRVAGPEHWPEGPAGAGVNVPWQRCRIRCFMGNVALHAGW